MSIEGLDKQYMLVQLHKIFERKIVIIFLSILDIFSGAQKNHLIETVLHMLRNTCMLNNFQVRSSMQSHQSKHKTAAHACRA